MNNNRTWVGENANTINERRLSKHSDGTITDGSIADSLKGKFPIGNTASASVAAAESVLGNVSITTTFNTVTPLTAEQRLIELKKKIAEYRSLLNVATDATTRNLVDLFLVNISKDLGEIEAELGKKRVQTLPGGPITTSPYPTPSTGPWYPQQPTWGGAGSPTIGDPTPPYTVCAGKTCITYGEDGSVTATTSGGIAFNGNSEDGK